MLIDANKIQIHQPGIKHHPQPVFAGRHRNRGGGFVDPTLPAVSGHGLATRYIDAIQLQMKAAIEHIGGDPRGKAQLSCVLNLEVVFQPFPRLGPTHIATATLGVRGQLFIHTVPI